MDTDDNIPEVKRKESIDKPTEPTYPWRRPSNADEVVRKSYFTSKLMLERELVNN